MYNPISLVILAFKDMYFFPIKNSTNRVFLIMILKYFLFQTYEVVYNYFLALQTLAFSHHIRIF